MHCEEYKIKKETLQATTINIQTQNKKIQYEAAIGKVLHLIFLNPG